MITVYVISFIDIPHVTYDNLLCSLILGHYQFILTIIVKFVCICSRCDSQFRPCSSRSLYRLIGRQIILI